MVVKRDLYAFNFGNPVTAYKITAFTSRALLAKTTLSNLPRNKRLESFSVSNLAGKIILTGGLGEQLVRSAQSYLMDLHTDRWQQKHSVPDLNIARCSHASLGLDQQVYVACGLGDDGFLASVEMLRLGARVWELIDIPDLELRQLPIFAQIDSSNICILGG